MPRPLRPQIAGGFYHVTSRGNRGQEIFSDDQDRRQFLSMLESTVARYDWRCHAYCLMDNHVHLVVETAHPNLSAGMQYLLGGYAGSFNFRHGFTGHLFQGRFHSVLLQTSSHLLVAVRYVVLNPVRAGMTANPSGWRWSSYRAIVGSARKPPFLETDVVLSSISADLGQARSVFSAFVDDAPPRAGP